MAIDTTIGGVAADSYASVAAADSYAAADLGRYAAAWAAATTDQKERALKRAARDLDTYVGSSAARWDEFQALVFPRWEDVHPVTSLPLIPTRVMHAAIEQAMYMLVNAEVIDDAATRRARGMSNWSEPNVSGALVTDPEFGRLAPKAVALLTGAGFEGGGATIGWIETT
jgi:hypothetical protein